MPSGVGPQWFLKSTVKAAINQEILEEDERQHNQQCIWPKGRYQRNLGSHYTWAVPQGDPLMQ